MSESRGLFIIPESGFSHQYIHGFHFQSCRKFKNLSSSFGIDGDNVISESDVVSSSSVGLGVVVVVFDFDF